MERLGIDMVYIAASGHYDCRFSSVTPRDAADQSEDCINAFLNRLALQGAQEFRQLFLATFRITLGKEPFWEPIGRLEPIQPQARAEITRIRETAGEAAFIKFAVRWHMRMRTEMQVERAVYGQMKPMYDFAILRLHEYIKQNLSLSHVLSDYKTEIIGAEPV